MGGTQRCGLKVGVGIRGPGGLAVMGFADTPCGPYGRFSLSHSRPHGDRTVCFSLSRYYSCPPNP